MKVLVTLYGEGTWIIMNSCVKKHELINVVIHELSVMHKYWHYLVLDLMQEQYFNQCGN